MIRDFCKTFGNSILGLIFGLSFFLLFLNFYHYREVNQVYVKQDTDTLIYHGMKDKLQKIDEISNPNQVYQGSSDFMSMSQIQSRLNLCVQKIDVEEFDHLLTKKKISISDVYQIQQFYQSEIADECMVKQFYDLIFSDSNSSVSGMDELRPFLENEINTFIKSTDYVQKNIKSNSSYFFSSDNSKATIYDPLKDSYYTLLNDYQNAIDFLYDIALWYQKKASV